jgi:hypothetical protein
MPLALVRGIKEAESQFVKQLLYSGIVNFEGPWNSRTGDAERTKVER